MYCGTLKNHVVSALKHRLRVIVRTASMKKNNNTKINSFLSKKFVFLRHENFILRVFIFVHKNVLCLW